MRILVFLLTLQAAAYAQDERFFRRIFTDELRPKKKEEAYKVRVSTADYLVDINRDGIEEKLAAVKKDGVDFFQVKDNKGRVRFEFKVSPKGVNSSLFKIQLKSISPTADALILHFDEGESGTVLFQKTARLYIVSIEGRDLDKLVATKGPSFFYEKAKPVEQYSRRYYNVSVVDFNKDGVREVAVAYNKIQRIYFYRGNGKWDRF